MKYLFYEKETETKAKVVLIYHEQPPQEMLESGNFVQKEIVEEPEMLKGKSAMPYCNPETSDFWYEYKDRPLTEEEVETQEAIEKIEDEFLLDMVERGVI